MFKIVRIRDTHVQNTISVMFPEIPNKLVTAFCCWCRHSFGLYNIYATTWVDLWFVADYRWDETSGGKVLQLKLDFVMALAD